jgi:hypothetical protein
MVCYGWDQRHGGCGAEFKKELGIRVKVIKFTVMNSHLIITFLNDATPFARNESMEQR